MRVILIVFNKDLSKKKIRCITFWAILVHILTVTVPSIGQIFMIFLFHDFFPCVNDMLFKFDVILSSGSLSTAI